MMRLLNLSVEGYQAIERANLELGPGLNILFGPNDLGKSTLASALRAVLLVPPASSVAESFASWYANTVPRVSLTFMDEAKRYWRVDKLFGSGAAEAATLSDSRDGQSYTLDCRGRQVEEKLRDVLGWGIPAPGGRGGPRGLPTSFLTTVLLGSQTDVDGILAQSLAGDLEDSGKLRLTKALAVLAQDPLFRQVLAAAQTEVDCYFTASDRRKTGQTSKFTAASNRVKELQREIATLETELAESTAIEQLIVGHRERYARGVEAVTESSHQLEQLESRSRREQARHDARAALDAARAELAGVDAQVQRIAALDAEIGALEAHVAEREAESRSATAELDAANLAVQGAEEAHRLATGEGAERERELRRAQCAEKLASATQRRQALEARRDRARAALDARSAAEKATLAVSRARTEQEKAALEHGVAQTELQAIEAENAAWLATVAYARWHAAVEAAAERERVLEQADADRREADAMDREAGQRESTAGELDARLSATRARLPSPAQLGLLLQLEHDLQLAEAALGGGISVEVKGRAGLAGRVVIDGEAGTTELTALDVERHLEAERHLLLSIEDLLQIDIRAGAPDKRRAAEALRARHAAEVAPVLESAGLASLAAIRDELTRVDAEHAQVDQSRRAAASLRAAAQSQRERAAERRSHADKLAVRSEEVTARRDALGTHDLAPLKTRFESLGASGEARAEALAAKCLVRLTQAREALAAREKAATIADFQLNDAREREGATQAVYTEALAPLETDNPDRLLASVESELASLRTEEAALTAQLAQLATEASTQVASAARALAAARARVPLARQALEQASLGAEAARRDHAKRQGERAALQTQLDSFDREALSAIVRQRQADLAAFGDEPDLPATALETARHRLDQALRERDLAKEELNHAEGKLSSAGGAALHENVERLREALQHARDDELEVEVEAEAWKLLRNTLREVENEEGAHLGRALAGPLTTRFRELTADRYQTLTLSPLLKLDAVSAATTQVTGTDVLAALSVGTRDQLATLIRLAIAEELGSAIVLDDHLVHSDPRRLSWFRQALSKAAVKTQVVVLTCRPQDYLSESEMPISTPWLDLAGGAIRAVDLSRVISRYQGSAPESSVERIETARAS